MRGRTGLTTRSQDVSPPAHSLPFNLHALAKTEEVFASLPTPPVGPGTATLPHPNPTHSFWTHSTPDANPLAKEGSDAPLPPVVDVAIIGSGISGIGVAYHLAELLKKGEIRKPISIAVFEARDFCAGATGRNDEWSLARNVLSNLTYYTQKFGRDECLKSLHIERQCVDDIVGIVKKNKWEADVDLAHGGNLRLHFTKEEEQEDMVDFRAAKEAGIKLDDVEWLDAEKTKEKYGAVFPSTLIDGYNIWPLKLVTKLFNFAKSTAPSAWYTLSLYTHTPVTSIASGTLPWNVWALETPRGSVMAKVVVHCTNAYVSHLLPHMSGQDGVVPTRGQVIATRASVPRSQLWNTSGVGNEGFEYWFPRPEMNDKDGCPLIIIGGGRENTGPKYEFYTTDDSTVNPEASKVLRDFLPAVYPEQFDKGTAPEMEWTGIMGYTKTYEPIVRFLDAAGQVVPGQYMSVGFSGHGMTRAFRCAEAIASMVHDELSGKLVNIPEWLPKHYLRGWKIPQPRSSDESGVDAGKL
ncbi:DAO-domain-containing protein [Dacryopinax primogenitus]|uniref:DAO-domain-containing protein n=1 Tax=Dacryopinax primogenitus (strain DJM 731) TaxID=1858805 RepID=M5GH35_DACPD|nr:DAO-domain-containing protein [Dacryopinax primogenitus]EJU06548.1 DAO-domain-containing protein [Dacryopinax primogenitus]